MRVKNNAPNEELVVEKTENDWQGPSQYNKERRDMTKVEKVRDEKWERTTDSNNIQRTMNTTLKTCISINCRI